MFKKYFSQSIGQLRQHPLISALTIMATALSLFLIMVVVMIQQVKVAPYSPESNRDRFLHARYVSISSKNWNSDDSANGPMSMKFINECYKSLETPEAITIYALGALPASVGLKNGAMIVANVKETDDQFFRVFDLSFVEGRAYDKAEYEARRPLAIITETMAKKLYGTSTGVVGRELLVSYMPCQVLGVVKDVSNLTNNAYANIWVPLGVGSDFVDEVWTFGFMGILSATMLVPENSTKEIVSQESKRKIDDYNKSIEESGFKILDRGRPYDQEKTSISWDASSEPDLKRDRLRKLIIFLILLIVPAVNLSSMTQSRLHQRISEIGIRRAFGSTRSEIIIQIIAENLIVTLIAGIIGFGISVIFGLIGSEILFMETTFSNIDICPKVNLSMLLHMSTFLYALLFCFMLNLLSTGIPAFRASRRNIIESLNSK